MDNNRKNYEKKIQKCLKILDGTEYHSDRKLVKTVNKLDSTIEKCLPEYLYKFRNGTSRDIENLIEDRFYLSLPENFNDPLECEGYIDSRILFGSIMNMPEDCDYFNEIDDELRDEIMKDRSDASKNDFIISFLKRQEFIDLALDAIAYIKSSVRIGCLSENIHSTLMWSHYANEHKGFAVRYKTTNISISECKDCNNKYCVRKSKPFFPVVYGLERCDICNYAIARAALIKSPYSEFHIEQPIPILPVIQKQSSWEYEYEWRIVCRKVEQEYVTLVPDAIIVGCRTSTRVRNRLKKIAEEKGLSIYEMNVDFFGNSYDLEIQDLNEDEE